MERSSKKKWTDAEMEVLRTQWVSGFPIKTWQHLLPTRSARAIQRQGCNLRLPHRGNGRTPGHSMTWRSIERVLSDGIARSDAEIAELIGLGRNYITAELRMHYPAMVHIGGYGERASGVGYWPRLWKLGPGEDAQRPKPMTKHELSVRHWNNIKKNRPEILARRDAKRRLQDAEKSGKLIRRDEAAAWVTGVAA